MSELSKKHCEPCRGGVPPLKGDELTPFTLQVPDWAVVDEHHVRREFEFPDFVSALQFTNDVGTIAELEGHHPDIYLSWGKVIITIWTHKINGLTESDFILASKIGDIYS